MSASTATAPDGTPILSAYERKTLQGLPSKIRCDVGKEWKSADEVNFSKVKLLQYLGGQKRGKARTPANSGIPCRVHSGEPETTLKCHGPCGKILGLKKFSKNTRVRGVYWCNDCTDWQLANEPSFMPYPAPYAPRAPYVVPYDPHGSAASKENAAGGDNRSVVSPSDILATTIAPSSVAGASEEDDRSTQGASQVTSQFSKLGLIYPHESMTPRQMGVLTDSELPHQARMAQRFGAVGSSVGEGSVVSESIREAAPPRGAIIYNAWDEEGNHHRMAKAPTVVTNTTVTETTTTKTTVTKTTATDASTATVGRNGWVKPALRKTPADAPGYIRFGRCQSMDIIEDDDAHSLVDGESEDEI